MLIGSTFNFLAQLQTAQNLQKMKKNVSVVYIMLTALLAVGQGPRKITKKTSNYYSIFLVG